MAHFPSVMKILSPHQFHAPLSERIDGDVVALGRLSQAERLKVFNTILPERGNRLWEAALHKAIETVPGVASLAHIPNAPLDISNLAEDGNRAFHADSPALSRASIKRLPAESR